MREMMNLGQKLEGVSHHEHASVTCKGAALFGHSNGDTHRRRLSEHPREHTPPGLRGTDTEQQNSAHPVYILKAKTSSLPFPPQQL